MTRKSLKVISLYTGAGGLDLGFEAAGFQTRVAVELDPDAVLTVTTNRPEWNVIAASIHSDEASSKEILRRAELTQGDAQVLIGGPPCQPFSKSGYWARGDSKRLADPRAATLEAYLKVLRDSLPEAFLIENVPGIAFSKKDEGINYVRQSIESINQERGTNYSFATALLRATSYGVPQDRQRVFIVGQREGREFQFPAPTHETGTDAGGLGLLRPVLTAWDAIGDLSEDDDPKLALTGKWADLLPTIPEGSNYLYHTARGEGAELFGWRTRYWSFLLKLAKNQPSWTIAAEPGPAIGPFHWKNRRLSAIELARLQTFPESYVVTGNQRAIQRQLGNAVPSALAEVIALAMRRQFFGYENLSASLPSLIPQSRGTPPDPESVEKLPTKFRKLIGTYDAHPGTGLGPGARAR